MPEKKDPTHYSELDPKSMNVRIFGALTVFDTKSPQTIFLFAKYMFFLHLQVNDLRQELVARNLSSKGLKSQLLARILKAIKWEQAKEEGRQDEADENEEDVSPASKEEDDKKFRDSKDVSGEHVCET